MDFIGDGKELHLPTIKEPVTIKQSGSAFKVTNFEVLITKLQNLNITDLTGLEHLIRLRFALMNRTNHIPDPDDIGLKSTVRKK
jgi:hypothetical protein